MKNNDAVGGLERLFNVLQSGYNEPSIALLREVDICIPCRTPLYCDLVAALQRANMAREDEPMHLIRPRPVKLETGEVFEPDDAAYVDLADEVDGWWNEICRICSVWTHGGECHLVHLRTHVAELLARGLRRQAEAAAKAEELVNELRASDLPPWRKQQDQDKKGIAATLEERARGPRRTRERRVELRGESSDEEGLPICNTCGACGSPRCFAPAARCRESDKNRLLAVAIQELDSLNVFPAGTRLPLMERLGRHREAVVERDAQKVDIRAKVAARTLGGEGIDPENQVDAVLQSPYRQFHRVLVAAAAGQGTAGTRISKALESAARRGREFTQGSCADQAVRTACGNHLKMAILAWKSETTEKRSTARRYCQEFMAKVPRSQWLRIRESVSYTHLRAHET